MYDRLKHTGWGINRLYWGDGPKNHTSEWTADRKAWKRSDAWQWVQQNLAEPKPKIIIEAHHGQLTRNPKPNLNPNPSPNPTPSPDPDPDPDPNPSPNPDQARPWASAPLCASRCARMPPRRPPQPTR